MIVATTEKIAGYTIKEHLGTVIGNTIRARHVGKDIQATFRTILGGEIKEYTSMMAESREQALIRMKDRATELGADAIVGVRFQTSMILSGTAEIIFSNTGVNCLQGPHQGDQKSTTTSLLALSSRTLFSKSFSLISIIFLLIYFKNRIFL